MTSLPAPLLVPLMVLWGLVGLSVGSFLSVVVSRLPVRAGLGGRSRCPLCHTTLGPLELIPIVSYVLQGAKCRSCKRRISWQYPLLEACCAGLFILAVAHDQPLLGYAFLLSASFALLLAIAMIDYDTKMIPDALSAPFVVLSCLYAATHGVFPIISVLIVAGFLALQWILSRGGWVGTGDLLLALGIGCLLYDWPRAVAALVIAYASGALVASGLLLTRRVTPDTAIAFAPFLAFGTVVAFALPRSLFILLGV